MTIEYSLFKKTQLRNVLALKSLPSWDVFISAFNAEDRVRIVFDHVQARRKLWVVLPDYQMDRGSVPTSAVWLVGEDEAAIVTHLIEAAGLQDGGRLCVDATGLLRQYLLVLIKSLQMRGVTNFDILYSEPSRYADKESTEFSSAEFLTVRQVHGFEGSHSTDTSKDLVIIAAGYEHRLVAAVSDEKNHAGKRIIYAFPSLRPDMFQESILATYKAFESIGRGTLLGPYFAPAYDPFGAAASVARIRDEVFRDDGEISNLYLAPLSTKPIAIGFALYYLLECSGSATSIIHPFMASYANRAAYGIARIWIYQIEVPTIASDGGESSAGQH